MATGKTRRRKRLDPIGVLIRDGRMFIDLPPGLGLRASPEAFWKLCAANRDLRLERSPTGKVIAMPPAGGESSGGNFVLAGQLYLWIRATGLGRGFDASAGYTMPDGAVLGPDLAWFAPGRWEAVPDEARRRFAPICPDFVVELRSPSDRLPKLRRKMDRYLAYGVRLAWLIDPIAKAVEVYRPGREPEVLDRPASLSGEDVLPGFVLDLRGIVGD